MKWELKILIRFLSAVLKDEFEPDTYSIHSYDGNVTELSTDKLAFHELGETTEVSFRITFSNSYDGT